MVQAQGPVMTHRKLLLLKWLMVFIPPATVAVGHSLWLMLFTPPHTGGLGHGLLGFSSGGLAETLLVTTLVTFLALVLAYLFAETLFRVLRRLQAEVWAQGQDILTMNAVMQERERLGRELHDGVAQLVADLLLRLDIIKDLVKADRSREAETELERLHGVADEIYKGVGESITGLRTNVSHRGLVGALRDYVEEFEERHWITTSFEADDTADLVSPLAALQVFRLVQEALTNVRKHAGAREATVTLMSDGSGRLTVVIADDGRGFNPSDQRNGKARPSSSSSGHGLGLTSMRERVEALGGTFDVQSQPGSGTRVTATIPIPRTRRESGHAAYATPVG